MVFCVVRRVVPASPGVNLEIGCRAKRFREAVRSVAFLRLAIRLSIRVTKRLEGGAPRALEWQLSLELYASFQY